ncbi:CHAT domain-containing protein, partial [Pseudomonas aeruginosa]|uniref:CHAT domain-containing protein n=1 Tax=Pseudomonas aeruginosa TaxID=287 RepID=UPI002F9196A7
GQLIDDQSKIWLEQPDGTADVINGGALAKEIWALESKPQLVVLASCQSAGAGGRSTDRGALAALGPLLSEAGVPAVLAMQGDVTMETVAAFMPVFFFAKLRETGLVDQAVAAARAAVAKRPDAWAPVLFMRLRDGLLWY